MDAHTIGVHHIGGRSGGTDSYVLPGFASDYAVVFYEADVDAVPDIKEWSGDYPRENVFVLPYCLGAQDGTAVLHINFDPYTSSLYPVTERNTGMTLPLDGYDYRLVEAERTMEHRTVALRSLDSLAEIRDGAVPPPTILVIDTEGSEAPILSGAAKTIREHTLAVQAEVTFREYLIGQSRFEHVHPLLEEMDFAFVGLTMMRKWYLCRQPIGLRGPGMLSNADTVYLRRISSIEDQPAQLLKLGIIALTLGHIEYAVEAWQHMPPSFLSSGSYPQCGYARLVRGLLAACDQMPKFFPKEFQDFYSWETSRARFDPTKRQANLEALQERRNEIGKSIIDNETQLVLRFLSPHDSPFESVLRSHGLGELADQVKARRHADTQGYLSAAGLALTVKSEQPTSS